MRRYLLTLIFGILLSAINHAQDTIVVQTLTYDSTGRNYVFQFPPDDGTSYEKIIMEYNMRCKGALVSTGAQPNLGCGEWDYSCNTYITDSSYVDSLRSVHPTHIISGFNGDIFDFTYSPTYSYIQYDQQEVIYNSIITETSIAVESGNEPLSHPFTTMGITSKSQYLWTADELTNAGLSAGAISSLRLNVEQSSSEASFLRIKMKHSSQTSLTSSAIEQDGFTEVYFLNTTLSNGENEFLFYNNFEWDGSSNILIEFSFTNNESSPNSTIQGGTTNSTMGLINSGSNYNLEFSGSEYLELPIDGFENISDEISIAFWSYGNPAALPTATTIFEGVDEQNRRQANVHLPWSNSQVYWDCGNDGNYDRINKTANAADFEGRWNHWTFTKNAASGTMRIYLNGSLWHSGTGKTKPINLSKFTLGSNNTQARFYYGNIDEFQIWNVELSSDEIVNWMSRSIDNSHPRYANLISYFKLDEGTGFSVQNSATPGGTASINGQANWKSTTGSELYTSFNTTNQRPDITLVQGQYDLSINTVEVFDTLLNNQSAITSYQVSGTDLEVQEVEYVWQSGYEYLYDTEGTVLDSFLLAIDGTINIGELIYYRKFPSKFEIMSFVTPYGIFLDLGPEGKTWTFDVSDFAPVLKDKKRMSLELGGQFQEEMDIRFLFIKGTPPREVRNIQQIWRSSSHHSYTSIINDDVLEPRDIALDPEGHYFKIRTMVTGHGQEGEFIPRTHWVNINGGDPEFVWNAWKTCGDNPVYPQGGTWIYDRAGWCPGAPTDLHEWDISDLVTAGASVNVDYSVMDGSGTSNYLTSHQLVTYGPANFTQDASIIEVKRPSNRIEYDRENPVCNDPLIVIQNTGSTPLTSATIVYEVEGGSPETFTWTGNLDFMETEEVILPIPDASFWVGNEEGLFMATISEPNGASDEYEQNNTVTSRFDLPDIYLNGVFIVTVRTNNFGDQTSYTLSDFSGDILLSRNGLASNTYYRDTLFLEDGCYTLEMNDTGGNGLEFWAQPDQGAGLFRVGNYSTTFKSFEPDFGNGITHSFGLGTLTNVETIPFEYAYDIFPNPSTGQFTIALNLPQYEDVKLLVSDVTGRTIKTQLIDPYNNGNINLELSDYPNGIYYCTILTDKWTQTKKVLKLGE